MAPNFSLAALLSVILLQLASAALSPITAVGNKFFTGDGDQFFLKGIAYQLSPDDPLLDSDQCTTDAKLMKELGANAIRVYHVEDSGDHKGCMDAFDDAGIYLFLDLDTFTTQIEPDSPSWNSTQYKRFTAVLDEFQQYDNLAGVFVGNEVLTKPDNAPAAPYVKAAARDIKAYRDTKGYRKIPVGYSAADIAELRPMLQNYLVCGGNSSETIDFYGLNAYEWCGQTDYQTSGYKSLNDQAAGYNVPIFFSETGCNHNRPRTFEDQAAILGPDMDSLWSGAIIYEWIEETNDYGLISYGGGTGSEADIVRSGTPQPVTPDFDNLKSQWATLSPTGVKLSAYSASASKLSTPACPSATPSGWTINGNPALPAVDQKLDPSATATGSVSSSSTAAAASASATKGAATGGKEITGMTLGLAGVMLGFVVWL